MKITTSPTSVQMMDKLNALGAEGFGKMMTRKHFIAIAEILNEHKASFKMIREFVFFLSKENPNFDYLKFQDAAGIEKRMAEDLSKEN